MNYSGFIFFRMKYFIRLSNSWVVNAVRRLKYKLIILWLLNECRYYNIITYLCSIFSVKSWGGPLQGSRVVNVVHAKLLKYSQSNDRKNYYKNINCKFSKYNNIDTFSPDILLLQVYIVIAKIKTESVRNLIWLITLIIRIITPENGIIKCFNCFQYIGPKDGNRHSDLFERTPLQFILFSRRLLFYISYHTAE